MYIPIIQHVDKSADLLDAQLEEEAVYVPQTKESRLVYDNMLRIIGEKLGDQSQEILEDVANEILAILKMDELKADEKKKELEAIFPVNEGIFSRLLTLSRELKDYSIGMRVVAPDNNIKEHIMAIDLDKEAEAEKAEENQIQFGVQEASDEEAGSEPGGEGRAEDDENNDAGGDRADEDRYHDDESRNEHNQQLELQVEDGHQIDLSEIDRFWLTKQLERIFPDPVELKRKEELIILALNISNEIECQNRLVELFDQAHFDFVHILHENRYSIYYLTRLARAATEEEKKRLLQDMKADEHGKKIYEQLQHLEEEMDVGKTEDSFSMNLMKDAKTLRKLAQESKKDQEKLQHLKDNDEYAKLSKTILNLNELEFSQGSHFMANENCKLPKGSFKQSGNGYEEVFIPPKTQSKKHIALRKIEEMPVWAQPAFSKLKNLNTIQSVVYETALKSADNMLICAPTGAGKTNIALLTILQQIGSHMNDKGRVDLSKFKIVYIAPMKALVTEVVGSFTSRLADYGVIVREMTGDMQLSRAQIDETNIIVATPEKWDIVTRKAGDKYFLDFIRLVIIDEIHLLHDTRGPVLESIVARTLRYTEQTGTHIRLVGLSATLPNYHDVADFLRVEEGKGLYFFDASYRPIPLEQQYIGITDKKGLKKMLLMKEILYQKVIERAGKQQILIFVHSRRETAKTAREIRDQAYANDDLAKFIKEDSTSKTVLASEAENCKNTDLKELLPIGIAIHHAGLSREDRSLVEDLYADRHIQVLISTATLAWGVNLPAKTVIIKGTQIYSPEKGKWVELSPQDILQMLGRGGRPNFDVSGEGIIITGYTELKYYLSLVNNQLPIESQFISQLADQLNAEVVLGAVTNLKEAVDWLSYTYLFVRMLRSPRVYGIPEEEAESDKLLVQRRTNLIHTAALLLDKHNLVKYDRKSGEFQPTTLGRIASHYYIKHGSIAVYNEHIKPSMTIIDLFRIFSLSTEFKYIPIRDNEKPELEKLLSTVPIPVRGSKEDPSSKVNILLQAYISRMKLDGYAINSDMVYVTQSAARIMRGLFEVFLKRGWASVAENCLRLCLMIDRRQWSCMSPLRQFTNLQEKILRRIENQEHLTWEHFYNMTIQQVGNIIKYEKLGPIVYKHIHEFPRLELQPYVQPITRSTIKVELTVKANFDWNDRVHGKVESFWIFVSDVDNEILLYHEFFTLTKDKYLDERIFDFTVPLLEPLNPHYFVKVISDKWLQCQAQVPISFKNLILPAKFPPSLELHDLRPIPKEQFADERIKKMLTKLKVSHLNSIQTQIFDPVFNTFDSYLLCAPGNSGKTIAFLLSAARLFIEDATKVAKILVILPFKDLLLRRKKVMAVLAECFDRQLCVLTGTTATDLQSIEKSHVILSTAEHWDNLSRKWRTRKATQDLRMVLLDHIHMLNENSSAYEVVAGRLRFMLAETEKQVRIIGTGISIANARDISEWLGIHGENVFNFHPKVRPISLEAVIHAFDQPEPNIRFYSMTRQLYQDLSRHSKKKSVIIFVSDKKAARLVSAHLNNYATASKGSFLNEERPEYNTLLAQSVEHMTDLYLKFFLQAGIGFIFEGMPEHQSETVLQLFKIGIVQVLVLTHTLAWTVDVRAHTVVLLDTKYYHEQRLVDYPLAVLHEMLGKSGRAGVDQSSSALIYCYSPSKETLKKNLLEPTPVESHLNHYLPDHLNAEIASKGVETKQDCMDWIAWTFFYRRVQQNPNFYNLVGTSDVHKNDHLSELIEAAVEELVEAECLFVQEDDRGEEAALVPINGGMIASHYYINVSTISIFVKYIKETSKWKNILEILSAATEFEPIGVREGEEHVLKQLFTEIRHKPAKPVFTDLALKINIILQSHFERKSLPTDLRHDRDTILVLSLKLIQALVDCIGYNSWLKPAIMTMKVSQMAVQGLWVTESPLLQLPHFTHDLVQKCKDKGIITIGRISFIQRTLWTWRMRAELNYSK